MTVSTRASRTSPLAAASATVVVAVSLICGPKPVEPQIPQPIHIPTVQLQALAHELLGEAVPATTAPSRTATKTPQANESGLTLNNLLQLAISVAAAPFWYAAFPITLPLSLLRAFIATIFTGTSPCYNCNFLAAGLTDFPLRPFTEMQKALQAQAAPVNPTAAVSDSSPAAQSSSAPHAPLRVRPATSGLAGSRRIAGTSTSANRTPSAHPTAKTTPPASTQKKHSGTARSARPARTAD